MKSKIAVTLMYVASILYLLYAYQAFNGNRSGIEHGPNVITCAVAVVSALFAIFLICAASMTLTKPTNATLLVLALSFAVLLFVPAFFYFAQNTGTLGIVGCLLVCVGVGLAWPRKPN